MFKALSLFVKYFKLKRELVKAKQALTIADKRFGFAEEDLLLLIDKVKQLEGELNRKPMDEVQSKVQKCWPNS